MVVIVIIGVLAALSIPKFTDASAKAKASEPPTVLASYDHAQLAYLAETNSTGAIGTIAFDPPQDVDGATAGVQSKWFTYTDQFTVNTAATGYDAVAFAAFGKVVINDAVTTDVALNSNITHASTGGFVTYLPNWK
jgi:type II secretory pathway pseudopilin PulG